MIFPLAFVDIIICYNRSVMPLQVICNGCTVHRTLTVEAEFPSCRNLCKIVFLFLTLHAIIDL